jgi:hypothetical protein
MKTTLGLRSTAEEPGAPERMRVSMKTWRSMGRVEWFMDYWGDIASSASFLGRFLF